MHKYKIILYVRLIIFYLNMGGYMNSIRLFFRDFPIDMSGGVKSSQVSNWMSTDTESKYKENHKNKKITYNEQISYNLNSLGYRCNEFIFDNDDFNLVTVGCSIPCGIGVRYEDSFPYIIANELSTKMNKKVNNFNLSLDATGIDYAYRTILSTKALRPNLIILSISYMPRVELLCETYNWWPTTTSVEWTHTISNKLYDSYLTLYSDEMIMYNISAKIQGAMAYAASINSKIILVTLDWHVNNLLKDLIDIRYISCDNSDKGRDGLHPGPIYHKNTAISILSDINKIGIV